MKRDTSVMVYNHTCGVAFGSDPKSAINKCIEGYGEVAATITIGVGGLATVVTASNHIFFRWQVVAIAGATSPITINGNWKIEEVTGANSFTMLTDYTNGTSVAGSITVKAAPLTYFGTANNYSFLNLPVTVSGGSFSWTDGGQTVTARMYTGYQQWYLICSPTTFYLTAAGIPLPTTVGGVALFKHPTTGWRCAYPNRDGSYQDWGRLRSYLMTFTALGESSLYFVDLRVLGYDNANYFGQSSNFFPSGINPVDGKRAYYPVCNTYGPTPGLYAILGLNPVNGIYDNMLHFTGSTGYGFCFDLCGPWSG